MGYKVRNIDAGSGSNYFPDGFGASIAWFATEEEEDKAADALLERSDSIWFNKSAGANEWQESGNAQWSFVRAGDILVDRFCDPETEPEYRYELYAWGFATHEDRLLAYCRRWDAIYGASEEERLEADRAKTIQAWADILAPERDFDAAFGIRR